MPQISKYELIEALGGGMSEVWRARDTVLGRTVAVKILTPQGCSDAESKSRFLEEARIASNIHHDNIIAIHDYGEDGGRPFMVMEFLVGEDLRHAIRNGHTGDLQCRLGIAIQVARALEHVHSRQIVHRDIKPENIHIDASGKVKLMDFGIAKAQGMSLTQAGMTVGTPYYMAPEQVLGMPVTEQVDVYAFGALLHELICGRRAVEADTVERLFYLILNEPIDLNSLIQAGAPEPLRRLVERCTAKKREDRIGTMREVREELERLASPKPVAEQAPPPSPAPEQRKGGRRKTPVWIASAALLLVVAGVAAYLIAGRKQEAKTTGPPAGMLLVPAGSFRAGQDRHSASLPDFYIDKTEVTNAEYAKFCQATSRPVPQLAPGLGEYPATNVTYYDATAFASWAGKRLPTALEWEKAARGGDGRVYPWGDEPRKELAAVDAAAPVPETLLSGGASPYGAVHMAGNAAEWVDQRLTPSLQAVELYTKLLPAAASPGETWFAIKGGSFKRPIEFAVTWEFSAVPAHFSSDEIGFRCVKDPAK